VEVIIRQHGRPYRLDVPVQVEFGDGSATAHSLRLADSVHRFTLPVGGRAASVRLDPAYLVPHATPATLAEAGALAHVTRGKLHWDAGQTDSAVTHFAALLARTPDPDSTPARFLAHLYLGWIDQEAGRADDAAAHYQRALALPVRAAELVPRAYLNLARAEHARNNLDGARWAALAALAAERGESRGRISRDARGLLDELDAPPR
jgi:tetratricopeptide (TPR) repeat protein